jgi:apolipoprotein N-acyltransferase
VNDTRPLLRPSLAWTGAALSGVLYWAAFAGIDIWPLAFVALGPLWIALQGQPPKRAFWLAALAGTTMNVLGFYWLLNMLQTFSGFPTVACVFFLLVVCTYQGLRVGLLGWLYARGVARGWPRGLVVLGAFVGSEMAAFLLLFPWYLAGTVHQIPALIQIADLGGPVLVGLMLLGVSLALFEPVLARLERRPVDARTMVTGLLGLGFTLLYGFVRIPRIEELTAAAPAVKVGVVQGNMGLMAKREDPAEGLRRHVRTTAQLREEGAQFVVWSESSVTFPVPEDLYQSLMKSRVGQQIRIPAIFGGVLYNRTGHERWYNVALSTDREGSITGRYDKEYLLQFGEHLPFSEEFPILNEWSPNSGRFTPGTKLDPLTIDVGDESGPHKIGVLICYEDIIPSFTNALSRATEPDVLVNITNDAWFGDTTEPWEHLALAQLRAVEHRRYLIRSTNSGVSAVVDPVGRVVSHTEVRDVQHGSYGSSDHLVETMHWMRGAASVYELVGDAPWWLITVAVVAAAFVKRRKPVGAPQPAVAGS